MITLSPTDLQRLGKIVVVANTPSFIWSRFKRDTAVVSIAESATREELFSSMSAHDSLPEDEASDVKAYAFLVAFLLKFPEEAQTLIESEPVGRLLWARDIARIAQIRTSATSSVHFSQPPALEINSDSEPARQTDGAVDTTSSTIIFRS